MAKILKALLFIVDVLFWLLGVGIIVFFFALGFDRLMEPVIASGVPEAEVIAAGAAMALMVIAALAALIIKR